MAFPCIKYSAHGARLPARSKPRVVGRRFVIEDIYPSLIAEKFPVKRVVGESFGIWADIFAKDMMSSPLRCVGDG